MHQKPIKKISIIVLLFMLVITQGGLTFAAKGKPTPVTTSNLDITTENQILITKEYDSITFTVKATLKSDFPTVWAATELGGQRLNDPSVTRSVVTNRKSKIITDEATFTFIPTDIIDSQTYTYTISATNTNNPIDTDSMKVQITVIDPFSYVALGDSIPNGVSYNGTTKTIIESYTDKLANQFSSVSNNFEYFDHSVSGDNSIDLLNDLDNNSSLIRSVEIADIITLCIGSNDLMDAAIQFNLFGINVYDFYKIDWNKAETGRKNFESNWPQIIKKIETLNPDVTLFVTTIYNPYNYLDVMHDPVNSFMWNSDPAKYGINDIIHNYPLINSTTIDYKVIDVHGYFESKYGDSKESVTGFYDNTPYDPHPDAFGQSEIYELHKAALPQ